MEKLFSFIGSLFPKPQDECGDSRKLPPRLPPEVIEECIFSFFSGKELGQRLTVSRKWRVITMKDYLQYLALAKAKATASSIENEPSCKLAMYKIIHIEALINYKISMNTARIIGASSFPFKACEGFLETIQVLVRTNIEKAKEIADSIEEPETQGLAYFSIVKALVGTNRGQARDIAESINNPHWRRRANEILNSSTFKHKVGQFTQYDHFCCYAEGRFTQFDAFRHPDRLQIQPSKALKTCQTSRKPYFEALMRIEKAKTPLELLRAADSFEKPYKKVCAYVDIAASRVYEQSHWMRVTEKNRTSI